MHADTTRSAPPDTAPRRTSVVALVVAVLTSLAVGATASLAFSPSASADPILVPTPVHATAAGDAPDDGLPDPEPTTDESNERAEEIVSGARFQEPPKSVVERILEWIGEQLDRVDIPGVGNAAGGGSQVIVWLFIAVLAGLAIFLLTRMRLTGRRRREPDFAVEVEAARSENEWTAEAERFEADGQWKQALRCRFRALVRAMIERGVVRDIPGRTTGEYRAEVARNAPEVHAAFSGGAELFERAWYGDQPTAAAENARFRELADQVVSGLEERRDPEAAVPAGFGAPT